MGEGGSYRAAPSAGNRSPRPQRRRAHALVPARRAWPCSCCACQADDDPPPVLPRRRDVSLAELRESNRHALQCVVDLVKDYDEPQLEGTIGSLMQELQLRPPSRADGSGMGMSLDDRPGSVGSLSVQSLELEA